MKQPNKRKSLNIKQLENFPSELIEFAKKIGVSDDELPTLLYHVDKLSGIIVKSFLTESKKVKDEKHNNLL